MSNDFTDLLELFKQRWRDHVRHLADDDEHTTAAVLADIQNCIVAIEAVMAETVKLPDDYRPIVRTW
jgi:hypothetical protein